jgi:hypothetical protein
MKRKQDDGAVAQETICRIRESYQTRSNYSTGGSTAANGIDPGNEGHPRGKETVKYGCTQLASCGNRAT